jgi:hypothetical protein
MVLLKGPHVERAAKGLLHSTSGREGGADGREATDTVEARRLPDVLAIASSSGSKITDWWQNCTWSVAGFPQKRR